VLCIGDCQNGGNTVSFFNNQEEAVSKWSVKASLEMDASSGPGSDCIEVSQAIWRKLGGVEYGTTRKLTCNGCFDVIACQSVNG
jgi:hypothetical protein